MKNTLAINLKLEGATNANDGKDVPFDCVIGLSVAIDTNNQNLTDTILEAVKKEVSRVIEQATDKAIRGY